MTVFPQPKAPGMAVVPPCTHLGTENRGEYRKIAFCREIILNIVCEDVGLTGKGRPELSVQSAAGDWRAASLWRVALVWRATLAPWWTSPSPPQTPAPSPRPDTQRHTHAPSARSVHFTAAAGGVAYSRWRRIVRVEPRRSRCLCFWEAAWSCAWWGSFLTPCHRCLLLWCDYQPKGSSKKCHPIDSLNVSD